jgi:primary-amine oxidase
VTWQSWRLRFGFNLREGLVLYQVGFNDAGRLRPILYRASVSEVLTAYGDPDRFWSWMQIFDEGSFGLGYESTPVTPGREVPANAMTLGAVVPDPTQQRFSDLLADRIYFYERDGGNLIYYQQLGRTVHARATELVIGSLVSLGNYTYAFNWVFRQDGSFAFETELSGDCSGARKQRREPDLPTRRRRSVRRSRRSQPGRHQPSALVQFAPRLRYRRHRQCGDGKQREAGSQEGAG